MKLPKHYFCLNDMTPQHEVEECIMQECESAGLIYEKMKTLQQSGGMTERLKLLTHTKINLKSIKNL